MKKAMKGMIIFFSVVIVGLIGVLVYTLVTGGADSFEEGMTQKRLINTQTVSMEGVNEIDIEGYNCSVVFKKSDNNEMTINEYGSKQYKTSFVTADSSGDVMKIEAEKRTGRSWFVFGNNYRYMEIFLPEGYQGGFDINTSSGDINVKMSLVCSEFTINTSSGYVYLEGVNAKDISINTQSGDITSSDILSCTKFDASTSSGYLYLGKLTAESGQIHTSSGDVNVDVLSGVDEINTSSGYVKIKELQNDADIQTQSGDITVKSMKGRLRASASSGYVYADDIEGSAQIRTSSGDANLSFIKLDGDLDIETSSGYVKCVMPKDAQFEFSADTNSGEISAYFEDQITYNKKGNTASGTVGQSGAGTVTVSTSSGDIRFTD